MAAFHPMRHYHSLEEVSAYTPAPGVGENIWFTIGVFDGVHLGHREIIRKLTTDAHANHASAAVLTFDPHPASVLSEQEIKCLTTADERAEMFGSLGVDIVITQPFTRELAASTAKDFMARIKRAFDLKRLLIGYDFALGRGREGNANRLAEIGSELGYSVEVIQALSDESGVISSTEIRKLVATGNVTEATKLLGYNYALGGEVIRGAGRGRTINFPTANIDYPKQKITPANGIYACWAHLGDEKFMAATNIGFNPTFTPEKQTPSLEAYLLDFDRDIYGQQVKLEFVSRIRNELKFNSIQALIWKIQEDVDKTRELLTNEMEDGG